MENKCIFDKNHDCTNCNECDICDLDNSKICDSCGKCLKSKEEAQINSIGIDEILEEGIETDEFELDDIKSETHYSSIEGFEGEDDEWILIDDIPGLKEMIEDDSLSNLTEEFPGLMVFKKEG